MSSALNSTVTDHCASLPQQVSDDPDDDKKQQHDPCVGGAARKTRSRMGMESNGHQRRYSTSSQGLEKSYFERVYFCWQKESVLVMRLDLLCCSILQLHSYTRFCSSFAAPLVTCDQQNLACARIRHPASVNARSLSCKSSTHSHRGSRLTQSTRSFPLQKSPPANLSPPAAVRFMRYCRCAAGLEYGIISPLSPACRGACFASSSFALVPCLVK